MADTYTQLRVHIVFSVLGRDNLIQKQYRQEVEKYITALIQKRRHKLLAIYCMPDHTHIFIGWHPAQGISVLVEQVKKLSKTFINDKKWMKFRFDWQRGYGAFSYSKSQTDAVVKYILNQEQHHKKRTFKEEYLDLLNKFEIDYKKEYLFEFYE